MPEPTYTEPDAAFDIVHAELLRSFPEEVIAAGGDPDVLLGAVGIDADLLASGSATVTYRQLFTVLERAADTLACPDFGLRLAARQGGWRIFGPLGSVMRHSKTFGEALRFVAEHDYAHSIATRIRIEASADGDGAFVRHDVLIQGLHDGTQSSEQTMLLGQLGARQLTGGIARGRRVYFRHQPMLPAVVYRRWFGCDVLFGQDFDGIFFNQRDLDCPIVEPDSHIWRAAVDFIERGFDRRAPPLAAQVRALILQYLGSGRVDTMRIAADLHLHPRTLHRRLAREGTSFLRIKDAVRREIMLYDLRHSGLDLARISEKLGFAEQSAMTRRCRSWFAVPPTKLRGTVRLPAARTK